MRYANKNFFLAVVAAIFTAAFSFAEAAGVINCGGPGQPSCQVCDAYALSEGLLGYIVWTIAPLVAVIAIMAYGLGMIWKAAEQNPAGVYKYKRAITAAVIGIVVIFLAEGMVNLIIGALNPTENSGIIRTYTECVGP